MIDRGPLDPGFVLSSGMIDLSELHEYDINFVPENTDKSELELLREINARYREAFKMVGDAFADTILEVSMSPSNIMDVNKSRAYLLDLYYNIKKKDPNVSNKVVADAIDKAIVRISDAISGQKKYSLKDVIDQVAEFVESKRMCFAFIKALMCSEKLPMDDFDTAVKKINEIYEGNFKYKLDAHDLAKMNILSFRFHPSKWDINKAPVSGIRFSKFLNIANMTLELAKKM